MKIRDNLGQFLDAVFYRGDEVVIERAGKAVAVLVPVGRYEQYHRDRQERFKIRDRIDAKTRKVPAKAVEATIAEAARAARARRRSGDSQDPGWCVLEQFILGP
jgi:antitoxin (DNA-binding transcriptional repressor) of toxin-antitoxin stability system